jgi:hypothetical protein
MLINLEKKDATAQGSFQLPKFLLSGMLLDGCACAGLQARKMHCVAVIGGGLMGSGIATALVMAGYEVLLKEVNQQFLKVSEPHWWNLLGRVQKC